MPGADICAANLTAWTAGALKAAEMVMSNYGMQSADYAKGNHPWQNQTGLAEAYLGSFTQGGGFKSIETFVFHGVTWGVHLEERKDFRGKYMILDRAITHDIAGLMGKLQAIFGSGIGVKATFASGATKRFS